MGVASTNTIAYKLVASGSILDLFDDEDILVSDNITGLFDVGTLPVDFSRTIVLPATKKNNAFFEHVYDISIEKNTTNIINFCKSILSDELFQISGIEYIVKIFKISFCESNCCINFNGF